MVSFGFEKQGSLGKKLFKLCLAASLVAGAVSLTSLMSGGSPDEDIKTKMFSSLAKIRETKKQQVLDLFREIERSVGKIKTDKQMLGFFKQLRSGGDNPELEYELDKLYATRYGNFYDILFVDASGFVFHSIRKEEDYRKNLLTSNLKNTSLAEALKGSKDKSFVEFKHYLPSHEPAAFFTVAQKYCTGQQIGWFFMQVATNSTKGLGRTGEFYLVNKDRLMLSDSRFIEDSTILRQKVDTLAVKEALRRQMGEGVMEDYRGEMVFSSYERFEVFGVPWVIIAEIDEGEVLTEYYKKYKEYFQKEFVSYLADRER